MSHAIPNHFDFIIGDWTVQHQRLDARLCGCQDWTHFTGTTSTRKILDGFGNVEDNVLHLPDDPYRAVALRSYDANSSTWSIWWLDGRRPHQLDVPVVGAFANGVGTFYANDILAGQPILVRFTWYPEFDGCPQWEQAFSADAGVTWETNWIMRFKRLA